MPRLHTSISSRFIEPPKLILIGLLLVAIGAGCAGKAPKVSDTEKKEPGLEFRQAQLAYHHFTDGSLLFSMGEYDAAAEAYERALRHDPESGEIRLSLAETYFRMRQFTRAVTVAQAISPKTVELYDLLGRSYGYMGQTEDARTAYLDLLSVDSTNTQAYWFLSRLALRSGRLEEAAEHMSRLARFRSESRIYNELGDIYIRMGRSADAVDAYRRSLDRDSSSSNQRGILGMAGALESEGRFEESAAYYKNALALFPDDTGTRRRLVHLYLVNRELDSAIVQIDEVLLREPDDSERIRLGLLLYDTEQYDRAESLFVSIAEADGEDSYLGLFYLGRISDARENPDAAKEYFRRATRLADTIPDAWIHWGNTLLGEDSLSAALDVAYRGMGAVKDPEPFWFFMGLAFSQHEQFDSAVVWFEKAYERDSADSRVQFSLAAALERSGQFGEAAGLFASLIEREPTNPAALNYLGYMYADSGVYLEESLAMIERALEQDPDNGAYLDSFGWVLYRLGRYEEAERHIRRALEALESDSTVFDHLGDILAAKGRDKEAAENWQRALELDPDNEHLRRKLQE